ncbi:MAG: hypothetical protein HY877_08370 [Deltaproteobacteria bacterium]|nr:hypothetical protein [Deltaproteobacteria bacterium]
MVTNQKFQRRRKIKKIVAVSTLLLISLLLISCGSASSSTSEAVTPLAGLPSQETKGSSGNTSGVTITNTSSSPKELNVGDLMYLDLNALQGSVDFSGVNANAEFLLSIANTSATQQSFNVQLSSDLSAPELDVSKEVSQPTNSLEEGNDVTEIFHEVLRLREREQDGLEMPKEVSFSASKSVESASPSISEGSTQSFKVLASLSSATSYVTVNGVAECVGSNVVFYVDDRVTTDILSSKEVGALCTQFDETVTKEQALFGSASDVNGDGKIVVFLTPQVNHLGGLGGGIVTGFFNSIDLHPATSSNPASNNMEILYIMVPDPNGIYGVPVSKSFALSNLILAVLPHELQHAISYNQHVFVNKGLAEEAWLNEGMSHLAEDLMGQNQENPSRYGIFLNSPSSYSLVAGSSPGLAARGAAYLFMRYLYEQSGNAGQFMKNMIQTSQVGTRNIETAFAGSASDFDQFGEFFLRWSVALGITDGGISQDRRYTYQPRVQDSVTGNWGGVCLRCNSDDNRGTVLSGVPVSNFSGSLSASTLPSSARFYKITGLQNKLYFSGANGSNGYGALIRTK